MKTAHPDPTSAPPAFMGFPIPSRFLARPQLLTRR
jgi:hypothetical protein